MPSIFDILNQSGSLYYEIYKIDMLFSTEKITMNSNDIFGGHQTSLKEYINSHLFRNWSYRGTCLSIDEVIYKISTNKDIKGWSENECFLYLEFVYNMVMLFTKTGTGDGRNQINTIVDNINKILHTCPR